MGFLPYPPADGIAVGHSIEPVNQIPHLQRFQGNASVSAHDLQVTLGNDLLRSATAEDYNTVKYAFFHMIGSAQLRYETWAAIDPEELIIGGNNDGLPLWKNGPDGLEANTEVDRLLCGSCDVANFARQFYLKGNLPLFRRLHRSGIIYVIDRRLTPLGRSAIRRGNPARKRVL